MPQPTGSDVRLVNMPLTNMSLAYIQDHDQYIASKVFPEVVVSKSKGSYATYTQTDWFRDEAGRRGETDTSVGSGWNMGTAIYSCDTWAIHKLVGDKTRADAHSVIDLDRDATEFVTQRLLLRREREWISKYFATGLWGTSSTPSNLWSDFTSSTPRADVNTGKLTILKNTGYKPNTLVLSYQAFERLELHPDLEDKIKYTSAQSITPELMAQLFGVERVLVLQAVYETAAEGATSSFDFTGGKHALLCYSAPRPSMLAASAGYTFVWDGVSQGLGTTVAISRIRDDHRKADKIEGEMAFDMKLVASNLGYAFISCVS